jgi:hypothetical protein
MRVSLPHISGDYTQSRGSVLAMLLAVSAVLGLAAGVGLAYVAGFAQVRAVLGDFQWVWIWALVGGLGFSFAGYYYAYEGIISVAGGPRFTGAQMRTIVTIDFAGFLSGTGGVLDRYALEAVGLSQREAKSRVLGLAGLELGVLALGGTATAIAVIALGSRSPPLDFTLPWAVIPVPGFLIAFWLAERYRDRLYGLPGWRGALGNFLESIHLIRVMFANPRRYGFAIAGMSLFWAADAFAVWAGLAAFGFQMGAAALFVGFATGMVFTRRTAPLAGAGILTLCLPLTLWGSGAPLAVAVVGVFASRTLATWLPMPASLALLPHVRRIGQLHVRNAEEAAETTEEPSLHRKGS